MLWVIKLRKATAPTVIQWSIFIRLHESTHRPLGYESVYLPLYKVADNPFISKGTTDHKVGGCLSNFVNVFLILEVIKKNSEN